MHALVTGGTGFIGSNVVHALLAEGHQVRVLVREPVDDLNLRGADVERVVGDIRDVASLRRATRGCDTVFHTAAKVAFWVPKARRSEFHEVNVIGTRNVMRQCLELGVSKVVHTSTTSVIGTSGRDAPTDEDHVFNLWDKSTEYERTKFAAEMEVWRSAALGLPVVSVLPTGPIGIRDRNPNPFGKLLIDYVYRKIPAVDGGANLIDVRDVARGHILAATHGRPGHRYILGHQNVTSEQLFSVLNAVTGVPAPKVKVPYTLALWLGHWLKFVSDNFTGRHPVFTPNMVKLAQLYYFAETEKAKSELGFVPQSDPKRAVASAYKWFLDHNYIKLSDSARSRFAERIESAAVA